MEKREQGMSHLAKTWRKEFARGDFTSRERRRRHDKYPALKAAVAKQLALSCLFALFLTTHAVTSLGDERLIDPIRNRLASLGSAESALDSASLHDVRDAITAHTLAGHVSEALAASMVLLNKHGHDAKPKDIYTGAMLAKSAGERRLAVDLLHHYLAAVSWPASGAGSSRGITALSFLATLQFEMGDLASCTRTLRMLVRVQKEPSIHHLSMLSTVLLRSGPPQDALSGLRALLGHTPATVVGGGVVAWPEYGLMTARGGRGAYEGLGGAVPHWRGGEAHRREAARGLEEEMRALQFPAVCRGRPLMLHSLGDRSSGWGMGSMLHVLTLALASAYAHNRTLVLPEEDEWWYSDPACRPKGFGCYFEPLSSCRQGDSVDIVSSEDYSVEKTYVPQVYRRQGLLWWRSHLLAFVWRPLPWVVAELAERMRRVGWPSGDGGDKVHEVAACHVRRGDKVGGGRTGRFVIEMDVYKAELAALLAQSGAENVYVAGDDEETVLEVIEFCVGAGVRGMYDAGEARSSKDNSAMMTLTHKVNITHYALDAICNVEMLARAQHLVGTFGSHFTRMAHELSFARGGYESPPISLDVLWFVNP